MTTMELHTPAAETLTLWTALISLSLYAAHVAILLRSRAEKNSLARTLYAAGYIVFLAHVASAFHFYHHWSHEAALLETGRQTEEAFGFFWGGGIYFNYAFTVGWMLDALWWVSAPTSYRCRSPWLMTCWHAYFAFMAVNATVVFGDGIARWGGGAVATVLVVLWVRVRSRK